MNCSSCSAPLPAESNRCVACNTIQDGDTRRAGGSLGERKCPRCEQFLEVLGLEVDDGFEIDRCTKCQGIFFDPGELETILNQSVSEVDTVDYPRLTALIETESEQTHTQVTYIRCPDCNELMHRKSYGPRSGVIVDRCREHGVWLDGHELQLLMKWASAGGLVRQEQRKAEEEKKKNARPRPMAEFTPFTRPVPSSRRYLSSPLYAAVNLLSELLR